MLELAWLKGLILNRPVRILGAAVGVAITVALLISLGVFITGSAASMTERATADIPVDWQVLLAPGANPEDSAAVVGKTAPVTALEQVGYADVSGFTATSGGTVQTTGPGKVLGLSPKYQQLFPAEFRQLIGSSDGVLVAQQTAANLHVTAGDTVTIQRLGLSPVTVQVDGVVDLPNADSLFQAVGVPANIAPQAPPDNVLMLPSDQWHQLFDPQAATHPDSVRVQLHVRLAHTLASDPVKAYVSAQQMARNLEAKLAGSGIVGNNLAARLDGVRSDALYSRVLFLFLGLPGVILAAVLTLAAASSGAARRRREQALLRVRGATTALVLRLAMMEALIVGVGGVALGIALAAAAGRLTSVGSLWGADALPWTVGAAITGLILAVFVVIYPAWKQAQHSTVVTARVAVGRVKKPLWQQLYLDVILLSVSAVVFWRTASTGYQVVLAPEGVAQTSVSYEAFIAPVLLWIGVALLSVRTWEVVLNHRRRLVSNLLKPVAHGLSRVVAASLAHQRTLISHSVVLVALALSFAASTAVFNSTFQAQTRVDAALTNGADVTVTGVTDSPPSIKFAELKALPSVAAAQPMQHRFAYVGSDLQDLYGIDPTHIGEATTMANAYFAGGSAVATLMALSQRPDGLLVSEETRQDYQLNPDDQVNLRLQDARNHQYQVVPFHFVAVVREFPTAPKDSFLVANASYITQQTGTDAAEIVLLRVTGNPAGVADRARAVVDSLSGAKVTDIASTQRTLSSSLTAVDLHGLSKLELTFAILLAAAATGLMMALGLAERQRTFGILAALGANGRQLGAFIWSEGLMTLIGGGVIGITMGFGIALMLVKMLTGVFDPPPSSLSVPWPYLSLLATAAVVSTMIAVLSVYTWSRRPGTTILRESQ
jgi:putative ABC transport system permease protein